LGWLGWLVAGVGSGGWWLVGGGWWLGMAGGSARLLIGFDIYVYIYIYIYVYVYIYIYIYTYTGGSDPTTAIKSRCLTEILV
jgi:hypothetical protein